MILDYEWFYKNEFFYLNINNKQYDLGHLSLLYLLNKHSFVYIPFKINNKLVLLSNKMKN